MAECNSLSMMHVFPTFAFGGQQVRLAALIKGLGSEFKHHIFSLNGDISAQYLIDGFPDVCIKELVVPKSRFVSDRAVKLIGEKIDSVNPDIVCTYNWGSMEAIISNQQENRLPHIHFEDGFGPDESITRQKRARMFFRKILLSNSATITPSIGLRDLAIKRWKLKEANVKYFPNGVEIDRFAVSNRDYFRKVVRVGSVGAIRPEKNFEKLVRAVNSVSDSRKGLVLQIVGDGPELESLREIAQSLQHGEQINFPGQSSSPEDSYAVFDIFAMSSLTEQMPLSLIEAMAAGLPVVATDVGDIKLMVCDDNKKFIVPADDRQAYSKAIATLSDSPELRAKLGQANAARAKEHYSLASMINQHRDFYRTVPSLSFYGK